MSLIGKIYMKSFRVHNHPLWLKICAQISRVTCWGVFHKPCWFWERYEANPLLYFYHLGCCKFTQGPEICLEIPGIVFFHCIFSLVGQATVACSAKAKEQAWHDQPVTPIIPASSWKEENSSFSANRVTTRSWSMECNTRLTRARISLGLTVW